MYRRVIVTVAILVLLFCCIPVSVGQLAAVPQPTLILPITIQSNDVIVLGENRPSEYAYQNWSFEYWTESKDVFSDINGRRPFPWGGEVFEGDITFLANKEGYSGQRSFQIESSTASSHGAIAVPDLPYKPDVESNQLYYLGCWVKYDITEGYGVRLTQQFFLPKDTFYPTYACYGKWLKGKSNGWVYLGLLVKAPKDTYKGDPVIELWGQGTVAVDEVYFGPAEIKQGNSGGLT